MYVAVPSVVVMTIAPKIAIALAECTDEGGWWKSIKVQRKNAEELQIEASAITASSLIVQRICYCLSVAENTLGITLLTVFPSLSELQCCASLPRLFGQFDPGRLASAASPSSTLFGVLGAVTSCSCFQAGHIYLHSAKTIPRR